MTSQDKVKDMVLSGLAAICKKLAEEPAVLEELRLRAGEFVAEYNSLLEDKGRSTNPEHFEGEDLLIRIARFLPRIADEMVDTTREFRPGSTVDV
jgi:hypothetical protein